MRSFIRAVGGVGIAAFLLGAVPLAMAEDGELDAWSAALAGETAPPGLAAAPPEVAAGLAALLRQAAPAPRQALRITAPQRLAAADGSEAWRLQADDGAISYTLGARRRDGDWQPLYFLATGLPARPAATFEDALAQARAVVLRHKTGGREISAVRAPVRRGQARLETWGAKEIEMPWDTGWVFMVDDAPLANWAHPCRYVFVAADLSAVAVRYALTPLTVGADAKAAPGQAPALEVVIPFVDPRPAGGPPRQAEGPRPRTFRYDGNVSNCYAVIVSGGYNLLNNHIRYWGDAAYVYSTLTLKYGYPKTNIYALVSDGLDPAADRSDNSNSPFDLDGDGLDDTRAAATAANVSNVLVELQGRLQPGDQLFVFFTDHGSPTGGGGEWDVELNLWNMEVLRDIDLKALTEPIACPVIFAMEQCYSGGFLNDLTQSNRAVATAAYYNESSYAGNTYPFFDQWAYHWTAAVRGFYPQTNAPWIDTTPCDGDLNGDGFVSFEEADRYAFAHKYSRDNPMYADHPVGLGKQTFFSAPNRQDVGMGEFVFDAVATQVVAGVAFPLRISAQNVFGDVMTNYAGALNLWAEAAPNDPGVYVGTGSMESAHPLHSVWMDSRSQVIYPPAVMGGARTLDGLALNITEVPPLALNNWTIRLKHTDLSAYPTNPVWETENWTIVQSTNLTISTTGWVVFAFSQTFEYNGTQSLMLDFSFHNSSYVNNGFCRATESTNFIAVSYSSDNADGEPLAWSNDVPLPEPTTLFPNLRFGPPPVPVHVAVAPTNLSGFVHGIWTGTVMTLNSAAQAWLHCLDATNAAWRGGSDCLAIIPGAPPALTAGQGAAFDRVPLSWDAAAGAETYSVWRSLTPDVATAELLADGLTSSVYDDVSATAHTLYYYWVNACSHAGCGAFSPAATGQVAYCSLTATVSTLYFNMNQDGPWPPAQSFYIINDSSIEQEYDAVGAPAWADINPRTGILAPGQSNLHTVTFNAQVTNRAAGVHQVPFILSTVNECHVLLNIRNVLTIQPAVPNIHHVRWDSTNPVAPFLTWETAATTIQDAVDAATNCALVIVANGVYATGGKAAGNGHALTNRVCVDKPITVRSLSGPAGTFIVGAASGGTNEYGFDAVRGVWLGSGATLSGFTVTNGFTFAKDEDAEQEFDFVGGGVFCSDSSGTISNCVIAGNAAPVAGGGVYQGTLYNSALIGNRATDEDAAGGGAAGATLWRCRILRNTTGGAGGGVADGTMYNCLVSGNAAGYEGGGVYGGVARSCVVVGNQARFGGGAAGVFFGGDYQVRCELYNSIVCSNASNHGEANHRATLMYDCCTLGWSDGENIYYGDPLFRNPGSGSGGTYVEGNYRLLSNSPCINRGRNEPWMESARDLSGNQRIWGGLVDMGAYEFYAAGVLITAPDTLDFSLVEVGTSSRVAWVVGNVGTEPMTLGGFTIQGAGAAAYQLAGLPGAIDAGRAATCTVTFVPPAAMTFTAVVAVVHDASNQPSPFMLSLSGSGAMRGDKYVRKDNPGATYPYSTWATAAGTIQDAADAAMAGDTIWVTNGLYDQGGRAAGLPHTLTNRVCIARPVTLRSVNGPAVTLIAGAADPASTNGLGTNAVRCAWLAEGATLIGFTLTNGATFFDEHDLINTSAGGLWCEDDNVVVSQCVFVGNSAVYAGGVFGGRLYHCEMRHNRAFVAGGVLAATVFDSRITANAAVNAAGGAANCELTRCSITGNSAQQGGGTYGCYQYQCLLAGNTGGWGGGAYGMHTSPFLFDGCVISNNTAAYGGGAYDEDGFSQTTNCLIIGNTASMEGGGLYRGRHYNPLILGNQAATNAGAIYSGLVHNGTIVGNTAGSSGGGAMYSYLNNSILVDNVLTNGALANWVDVDQWGSVITYTCTQPLPTNGLGNITNAPLFRGATDYRLQGSSPCINAGTVEDWMSGAADYAGNRRIIGPAVDMGAYEYLLAPSSLVAATNSGAGCLQLTWAGVAGAGGFAVFRSTTTNVPGTALAVVATNSFCDATAKPGQRYYYWVNAQYTTEASTLGARAVGWLRNQALPWLMLLLE